MIGCVYHSIDLDGHCSAAIVKNHYAKLNQEVALIYANYPDPVEDIVRLIYKNVNKSEELYIVDFALPLDVMQQLAEDFYLIWIDHHEVIKDYQDKGFEPDGLRVSSSDKSIPYEQRLATCELTWKFFYPYSEVPISIFYMGAYDSWRYPEFIDKTLADNVLWFQDGCRSVRWYIRSNWEFWISVLNNDPMFAMRMINDGVVVQRYKTLDNERAMGGAFEIDFHGFNTLVINRPGTNSITFESRPGYDV